MTALEFVKGQLTRREAVIFIMGDMRAKRLVAAWTFYDSPFKNFVVTGKEKPEDVLARMWSGTPINMTWLANIADVPQSRAQRIFQKLIAARIIWPDGSVAPLAQSIINREVGMYMNSLLPRNAAPVSVTPAPAAPSNEKPKRKKK